ncbi:hypothetical protein PTTG_01195 [Puccinia triticina 1-1 BBBD Race 1]|uniref:Uncharacterized protein n=1 Tax=Puccinia triticina (isolate 1-1 / race 1 (BBBD)) TaxID=630390 RepID=A0A180G5G9_PUCT1|nr:hypothetical protein PTTG_01195 [Puccinia triticina 1-1 BBBD Race 1]
MSGSKTATTAGKGAAKKIVTRAKSKIPEKHKESGQDDRDNIQETLGNNWMEIVRPVRDPGTEDFATAKKACKGRLTSATNPVAAKGHPKAQRSLQTRILEMFNKAEEAAESGDHSKARILLKICEGLSQVATGPTGVANPLATTRTERAQFKKSDF